MLGESDVLKKEARLTDGRRAELCASARLNSEQWLFHFGTLVGDSFSSVPPNSQHQPRTRQAANLRMQI